MTTPRRILVLYYSPEPLNKMGLSYRQHLQVLEASESKYQIKYHNVYRNTKPLRDLHFDAVIFHPTFLGLRTSHLFFRFKWELRWIKEIPCIKIAIPRDEYDHSEILDEWLYEWQISAIFCCFTEETWKTLYPIMHDIVRYYPALPGYIEERSAKEIELRLQKFEDRLHDIVYRASQKPYWLGSHGQLTHKIGGIFSERARVSGLTRDISTRESDAIAGETWLNFMSSGKTVIGCESGSSVLDRRGEIKAKVLTLLRDNPSYTFEQVASHLPQGWDSFSFYTIGPRHFEAIITKTCQVLVEGTYSGILKPDLHYISVKRDFSNLNEVIEKIKDVQLIQDITEQAYKDIYLCKKYSYQIFASQIEQVLLIL